MAYWQKRQEAAYKAGELKVNQYFSKLEKAFNQAKRELQKTIESFYWRYAKENGLTYAEAQKRLDKAEIGELREYIDLVMKNIGKYNQKVNNMSIKARVTRYQALEAQIDAILRELYAVDYEADAGKMMSEIYTDTYHRIWYDSDRYHGFHAEFAQTDARTVEELIKYPFNGANFSDRLWKQKNHLQSQLMESLTTMMIQGTAPQNIAKDFAKKMRVKKFDAYRLLHTESSFVMSEATHAGYKEDGVEQYQILATLDSKTCGICGRLDGKIYPVSEAVTGKNMPPFHPFCRCTDVPYYPDTPTEGQMRAARDADGNNIEVPGDMTYADWKKQFLDNETEKSVEKMSKSGKMKMNLQLFAYIPKEKLVNYALNPDHPVGKEKAKAFKEALGYTRENSDELQSKILELFREDKLVLKKENEHGKQYEQLMRITGPNGKTANVMTAWIKENKSAEPRLVSLYVTGKERR